MWRAIVYLATMCSIINWECVLNNKLISCRDFHTIENPFFALLVVSSCACLLLLVETVWSQIQQANELIVVYYILLATRLLRQHCLLTITFIDKLNRFLFDTCLVVSVLKFHICLTFVSNQQHVIHKVGEIEKML